MRIGFLLGAGVSLPAGMPCTQELTSAVLGVENYHEWSNERFREGGPEALPDHLQPSRLWTALLKKIQEHCQSYFVDYKSRPVNYEDLFFAASQIEEHLLGEYENPAIEFFTEALLKDLPGVHGREQLRDSAARACNYIRDVVESKLRREPNSLNHLTCLVDAMRDETLKGCDIFTLNHDLLIEKLLIRHEIPFDDGFGDPDKDVAWWKRSAFKRGQPHYFLKLHGSIDWFDYPGKGLAKVLIDDYEHACDGKGELLVLPDRPRMLVGTFNKIRDYFEEPYAELIATFRMQMKEIGALVVSGYSFGDKGINEVLSRWMRSDDGAKMVVLAGDENECFKNARGAIIKLLEDYPGRMRVYSPYLSGYKWQDLRGHLTA